MKNFTNQYSLSKTLRFELIPQGKTSENIKNKGLINKDQELADSYQKMKETIDGFHKYFIEIAMKEVQLTKLDEFVELYKKSSEEKKKDEKFDDNFKKVQESLRKEIVQGFNAGEAKNIFSKINKKELITEELEKWLKLENRKDYFDEKFKTFTTYFTGFNENRKNMYTSEPHSTAIAYRLIHENLPKFIDNIYTYKKAKESGIDINKLEENLDSKISGVVLDQVFSLDYFKFVLTQKGIDSYNLVIGGYTPEEGKTKVQGLGQLIILYNQTQEKKNRIPKLKQLYKQILSDKESTSFLPPSFKKGQEVLNAIEEYYQANLICFKPNNDAEESKNVLNEIKEIIADIKSYNLEKIYLKNDTKITSISQKIFGNYSVFDDALSHYFDNNLSNNYKGKKLAEGKEKFLEQQYINIALLQKAVDGYVSTLDESHKIRENHSQNCIANYFHKEFKAEKKEGNKEFDFVSNIEAKYSCIKRILGVNYPDDKKLHQEKTDIFNIKLFLDSLMEILHFVKPLALPKDSALEKDENFYGQFEVWFEQLDLLILLYNKVRNYATQKPYSVEKIKLNFENKGQFLGGWVDSHTESSDNATQAGGYLFRKKNNIGEYDYFVGFSADKKLFRSHLQNEVKNNNKSDYERLDYYQLKSASVYGNSYVGTSYEEDKNKLFEAIYKFTKDSNSEIIADFNKYIGQQKGDNKPTPSGLFKILQDKYPIVLPDLFVDRDFQEANQIITENLKNTILSLTRVPKSQTYKETVLSLFIEPIKIIEELSKEKVFSYFSVSKPEFEDVCNREEKPLFLFKINNKDLSFAETYQLGKRKLEKRGNDNLHTLYFKALMEGNQGVFDIGTGQVFFRKQSLKYTEEQLQKGHHYEELKDKFKYPIISNKRFAYDKFQFHLSITQNYQQPENPPKDFDENVLSYLKNNPDINIIGIDRGERHLVYLSLIDQKGNILRQESFNTISDDRRDIKTDYWKLLDKKGDEKKQAQKSWGEIGNIKELKEGYISQVVHKIAKMMVENNAIVVMEDFNSGFKRGRFKVEKQVYQKLEKRLIDKLNYLVFKDKKPDEIGGLYNALQLTNKFTSFKDLKKQSGFLFYVPAWNTSKIDPTTGFVNLFDTKYESVEKAKAFFNLFDSIKFNDEENYFEFETKEYSKFNSMAENTRQNWVICTYLDRIISSKNSDKNNSWDNRTVILTDEFKAIFNKFQIDFKGDLKSQIINQTDKSFFESLLRNFKFTLQMRNSNKELDYLISPVKNNKGEFFDSRKADDSLPKDADANGAYNIAKKGLQWLEQISDFKGENWKDLKLEKTNKGWLQFAQKQNI